MSNEEKKIESFEYITIDGKEPLENPSFFISKRFKALMYSTAIFIGVLVYVVVTWLT